MAGYLDQYGAGEERRENIVKKVLIALAFLIVVGGPLLYIFHNFRQESQLKQFFSLLAAHDYKAAYALWGCTDAKPCPGYSMKSFMQDWGPDKGDPANYQITGPHKFLAGLIPQLHSRSCGTGVIFNVTFGGQRNDLWIERNDLMIGFSPFPGCPAPNAMLGGRPR
jgi:hypothetical protein